MSFCAPTRSSFIVSGLWANISWIFTARAPLVVELDGSQHFELSEAERDMRRDAELAALGLLVLRFSNEELNRNFSAVCGEIDRQVRALARGRE